MRKLIHWPLDPHCRKIRILLKEKNLFFTLEEYENTPVEEQSLINPLPLLVEEEGAHIPGAEAIATYIEATYTDPDLRGLNPLHQAEIRRLTSLFDANFYFLVTKPILEEKMYKRSYRSGTPNSTLLRQAYQSLGPFLNYIVWLHDRRVWLAGETLSMADISAGAQVSVLDFANAIDWAAYPLAKEWYMRMKSRPSFQDLLTDHLSGFAPAPHYQDLDF